MAQRWPTISRVYLAINSDLEQRRRDAISCSIEHLLSQVLLNGRVTLPHPNVARVHGQTVCTILLPPHYVQRAVQCAVQRALQCAVQRAVQRALQCTVQCAVQRVVSVQCSVQCTV